MSKKPWACALCEATERGTQVHRAKSDTAICDWCEVELVRTSRKRCRDCGPRPLSAFPPQRRQCRACLAVQARRWRKANPDKIRIYGRTYEQAHREAKRARNRRYAQSARGKTTQRARNQRLYRADPQANRARAEAWKRANKERYYAGRRRAWPGVYLRRKLRALRGER